MARMARLVVPGYPHHVTQRGNRRQRTFFCDDDYRYYIDLVGDFAARARTEIWAYCLMPNHVHFVMVPREEDGLRAVLGEAHRRYTRHINFREGWRGHLWQERFHSFVMDESYLLATARYVERNPVAAGLCQLPWDWQWSSAQAHIAGRDDGLVKVEPMMTRVSDWRSFIDGTDSSNSDSICRHGRTGRPLGNSEFIRTLESLTGRRLMPRAPGRKPKKGRG